MDFSFLPALLDLPWPTFVLVILVISFGIWYLQVHLPLQEKHKLLDEILSSIGELDRLSRQLYETISSYNTQYEQIKSKVSCLNEELFNKIYQKNDDIINRLDSIAEELEEVKKETTKLSDRIDNIKERLIIINTTLNRRSEQ